MIHDMYHDKLVRLAKMFLARESEDAFNEGKGVRFDSLDMMATRSRYYVASALTLLGVEENTWPHVQQAIGLLVTVSGAHDWRWAQDMQALLWSCRPQSSDNPFRAAERESIEDTHPFCNCHRCK